jgi:hypothetical protein
MRRQEMNKCKLKFVISHLKQAIYELETANKIEENVVDNEIIKELKETLLYYQIKIKELD